VLQDKLLQDQLHHERNQDVSTGMLCSRLILVQVIAELLHMCFLDVSWGLKIIDTTVPGNPWTCCSLNFDCADPELLESISKQQGVLFLYAVFAL
jgi:hypothetical protein